MIVIERHALLSYVVGLNEFVLFTKRDVRRTFRHDWLLLSTEDTGHASAIKLVLQEALVPLCIYKRKVFFSHSDCL